MRPDPRTIPMPRAEAFSKGVTPLDAVCLMFGITSKELAAGIGIGSSTIIRLRKGDDGKGAIEGSKPVWRAITAYINKRTGRSYTPYDFIGETFDRLKDRGRSRPFPSAHEAML